MVESHSAEPELENIKCRGVCKEWREIGRESGAFVRYHRELIYRLIGLPGEARPVTDDHSINTRLL